MPSSVKCDRRRPKASRASWRCGSSTTDQASWTPEESEDRRPCPRCKDRQSDGRSNFVSTLNPSIVQDETESTATPAQRSAGEKTKDEVRRILQCQDLIVPDVTSLVIGSERFKNTFALRFPQTYFCVAVLLRCSAFCASCRDETSCPRSHRVLGGDRGQVR